MTDNLNQGETESAEPSNQTNYNIDHEEVEKKKPKPIFLYLILIVGFLATAYLLIDRYVLTEDEAGSTTESEMTDKTVFVLSGSLNFREGKSTNADIIKTCLFGERIDLIGGSEEAVVEDGMEIVWHEAECEGNKGWIAYSIDGQVVVGDSKKKSDYEDLFSNEYAKYSEYGKMKVWAYDVLIEWLQQQDMHGDFTIQDASNYTNSKDLTNIVKIRQSGKDKDDDSPYDYVVLMRSDYEKIAVYIKAETENSGKVIGSIALEEHIEFLTKKKDGEEIPTIKNGQITLSELNKTKIGTTDNYGGITGWFELNTNQISWKNARFVESAAVIDILKKVSGYDFGDEDSWLDYMSGFENNPKTVWYLNASPKGQGFMAEELSFNGIGYDIEEHVSSEFKNRRFITLDKDKAKLFIDILEKRLVFYIRENDGEEHTFYGLMPTTYVEDYIEYRNQLDEEMVGC